MSLTEIILTSFTAVVALGILTLYGYLKKLPDRVHQHALTKSEYGMKADLEQTKAALLRELELSKINQAELQIHKTKEFLEFTGYFNEILAHPNKLAQLERDPKKSAALKQKMLDLGARLYFFGSDETIRTYLHFRRLGSGDQTAESRMDILRTYGKLMLQMRRDLGYSDTNLNEDDFLRSIIVDWDTHARGQ